MKVLLTRPKGSNDSMLNALKKKGIEAVETPLMEIKPAKPCQSMISKLEQVNKVIFISQHAVKYFSSFFKTLPTDCEVFAVGERTSQALQYENIGCSSTAESRQDSEGLLQLKQLQSIKDERIVIVRGQGGRETLALELSSRGAEVSYCEVYQRAMPLFKGVEIAKLWQQQSIDTILITSGEMLLNLLKLIDSEQRAWVEQCVVVVPSERVAKIAADKGLTQVINANGASQSAMLTVIGRIIETL